MKHTSTSSPFAKTDKPLTGPNRLSMRCASWQQAAQLLAMNAQPAGARGAVPMALEVGASVELSVTLPNGQTLCGPAFVCDVQPPAPGQAGPYRCGVKMAASVEAQLRRLVEAAPPAPAVTPVRTPPPAQAPAAAPRADPRCPVGRLTPVVGIDFGTSYSSLAVGIGDRVYLVPDEQGRTLHPSVVAFPPSQAPVAGWEARPMLVRDPRRAVASIKRLLGRKFSDQATAAALQPVSYRAIAGPGDGVLVEVDGSQWTPPQIAAAILGHLRALGERFLGRPVRQLVLTVPASWTAEQTRAVSRAAELAKLEIVELLPEPVAGALAYGVGQQKNEIVGVYDFGGGTFDFSVVDITADHFRVLGFAGDAWLGGDDFDVALAEALANAFWRHNGIELRERAVEWQRLLEACERAKRALSTSNLALLAVEAMVETPRRIDLRQNVQRSTFEQLCRPLVERSTALCEEVLGQVGLGAQDLTQVIVTGGISNLPFVRDAVSKLFGRPIAALVHPDEAVGLGAGLRAAQRAGQPMVGTGQIAASAA